MAVTHKPWDGAASRYPSTEAYCNACLIDLNEAGAAKVQAKCMLPVKEPNGDVNANALSAAAGRINQVSAPPDAKRKAARALMRLYGMAQMDAPAMLRRMAGM